ncbi:MAG: dienelactone hydrolase family protein [Terriglobales bacterium]|jgi:carboxymethylenebutenolidase
MTNDEKNQPTKEPHPRDITRRDFATILVGAGIAAGVSSTAAAEVGMEMVETDVEIKTPDGTCDAAFIYPKSHPKSNPAYPGVLIWPDAFGLRPSLRTIGRNIASEGYSVLVPNPFYRVSKAPFTDASKFNFQNPDDMAKLKPLMASVTAPGNAEKDAAAYVAFLDAQREVNKAKKIGTQGYCMGGALVVRTAAALPDRIGAGASFHGGGLVTDKPDSPHLLAPKIKARMYFGIASSDDEKQPDAKVKLKAAFAAALVQTEIEVYPAQHGWCIPDMPLRDGAPIYNKVEAERAWDKLVALYRAKLT